MSATESEESSCRIICPTIDRTNDSKAFDNLQNSFVDATREESDPRKLTVINGNSKFVELLVRIIGVNVDSFLCDHPLRIAIGNNTAKFVELILHRGIDYDVGNCEEMTQLQVAKVNVLRTVAEMLLDKGPSVDSTIYNRQSHGYVMKTLAKNVAIEKDTPSDLHDSSRNNFDLSRGKLITGQYFDEASNFQGIQNGDVERMKQLLNEDPDSQCNPNLLAAAVDSCNLDFIQSLIKRNVDVNGKDEYGDTALHRAVLVSSSENVKCNLAKLLLSRGSSVHLKNRSGQTPLHLAAQKGYAKLVVTLLKFHANKNIYKNSTNDSKDISLLGLNDKVVLLYAKNAIGETALHVASSRNHQTVVEILLKHGIDIDAKTIFGKTALDLAFEKGCRQAFTILLKYGSDINVAYAANISKLNRSNFCIIKCDRGEFITSNRFCADGIRKHIVKVKTSGRFVSEGNLRCLDGWDDALKSYREECEKEVSKMTEKIGRNLSISDFLRKNVDQLGVYVRDKRLVRILESREFKKKFPIYSDMICYNFKRGQLRESLLTIGLNSFNSVTKYFSPPEVVIANIFRYLDNEDLGNLIEAWYSPRI